MRHHESLPKTNILYTIIAIGFIYTLHLVLPAYSNSSFLSLFASERNVGLIYMLGSALTILGFLFIPNCIRKIGNFTTILWLIIFDAVMLFGLIYSHDSRYIAVFFAIQTALIALIGFCLDIFLEVHSDPQKVGAIRGMYLATLNVAWIIGPLIGSMIIDGGDKYRDVYIASLFILFPLFYLIMKNFPKFRDPHYHHPSFQQTISHFMKNRDHSRLFIINSILQTYFAWMTVYMGLYLHATVGFSWNQVGIIITIMLIPFALIELPLGRLADKKYGEKEIMILGFAILGVTTMGLSFITSTNMWVWAAALFTTRIGAAACEVMIETYFFKTTPPRDSTVLGIFRITRYISFFTAPLITGAVYLLTTDQSWQFVALGIICLLAMIPIAAIKDTN